MYFELGFDHIVNLAALDHILFIVALCATYAPENFRKLLVLVTAFTAGHSLTLALSILGIVQISSSLVETLIPITILATAILDIIHKDREKSTQMHRINYLLALFFGLIHGLGFSNFLRSLLGSEENITIPLLAFNLGLELGQLIIVSILLGASYLITKKLRLKFLYWVYFWSGLSGLIAIWLIFWA